MFEEVAQGEKDEFSSATRDELINHISIQRTLIRNLYSKILDLEANPAFSSARGGSGRPFQSPLQQRHVQLHHHQQQQHNSSGAGGAEIELAAMNLVQSSALVNNSSSRLQQQQAETPSRLQQLAEGIITSPTSVSPKPALEVSPSVPAGLLGGNSGAAHYGNHHQAAGPSRGTPGQAAPSPTSPLSTGGLEGGASGSYNNQQPQDAAVLAKLQAELSNVRNAIDSADSQGLPSSTVEELYAMEEQLIDAIANISRGPQGDEVDLFRQGAYSRGMSTFTSATRDKATVEDVMLAQEGRFGTPLGSRSSTVRATPPRSAHAKSPAGRGRRQASPHSSSRPQLTSSKVINDVRSGFTSAASPPSARPQAPYGAEALETTSYVAEQRQTYRGTRAATPTRNTHHPAPGLNRQPDSATSTPSGQRGPPLALLRKLQYRLQDGAGGGAAGGGVQDTASSIYLATDSTTGQLVVNNNTGGVSKTPTKQSAAERISAFRRGRNSTPRKYN